MKTHATISMPGPKNQPVGLNSEVSASVSDAGDPGEGVMEVNSIG